MRCENEVLTLKTRYMVLWNPNRSLMEHLLALYETVRNDLLGITCIVI